MRRLCALTVLLALFGGAAVSVALRARPSAWLQSAEQAAHRRDFETARNFLVRFLHSEPNSYRARLLLAQISRRAGFLMEARVQLDVSELLQGGTLAVALERALVDAEEGNLTHESRLLEQAQVDPATAPLILEALARGYRKNYLLDNMLATLTELLKLQPDHAEALLERAWIHENRLDLGRALDDCRRAAALEARPEQAPLRVGQLLLLMEKPAEALDVFTPLRERRPDDPRVALGLFQACRKLGKTSECARLERELAARHPKEFAVLLERGRYLLEQDQASAAEEVLRAAAAQMPFDYQARYSLQLCLRQLGRTKEADEQLAGVKQLESDLKQMTELTDRLQKARFDPDIRCAIAKIFLRTGEEKEGLAWLKTVLRLDPGHAPAHQALAEYYERRQPALAEHHRNLGSGKSPAPP